MEIVDRRVPLSEIGKTVGPAPVPRFVANVRRNGVIIPVLLREVVGENGDVDYRIVDGNRRIAAARKARMRDIPARVLLGVSVDEAARLVFIANNFRSPNDLIEFLAIRHLERSGVSPGRIAQAAGLTAKSLAIRARWSTLDTRVFRGFSEGKISGSVASRIVRMTQADQRHFGDLYEAKGRIRTVDVQEYVGNRETSTGPARMGTDLGSPEPSRSTTTTGTHDRSLSREPVSGPLQVPNPVPPAPGLRAVRPELTQSKDAAPYGMTADHSAQNQQHSDAREGVITRQEPDESTDDARPVPSCHHDDSSRTHEMRQNTAVILGDREEQDTEEQVAESFPVGITEPPLTGHPSASQHYLSRAWPASWPPEPTPRDTTPLSIPSSKTSDEPMTIVKTDTIVPSSPPVTRYERTSGYAGGDLPADVQWAMEQIARVGFSRGHSLADLTDALTIAYRQVAFVEKTYKEDTRG